MNAQKQKGSVEAENRSGMGAVLNSVAYPLLFFAVAIVCQVVTKATMTLCWLFSFVLCAALVLVVTAARHGLYRSKRVILVAPLALGAIASLNADMQAHRVNPSPVSIALTCGLLIDLYFTVRRMVSLTRSHKRQDA